MKNFLRKMCLFLMMEACFLSICNIAKADTVQADNGFWESWLDKDFSGTVRATTLGYTIGDCHSKAGTRNSL